MCTFHWYMICSKYKGLKPFKHPLKNFNQEGYGWTDGQTDGRTDGDHFNSPPISPLVICGGQ